MKQVRVVIGPHHIQGKIGWLDEETNHIYFYTEEALKGKEKPEPNTKAYDAILVFHVTYTAVTSAEKKKEESRRGEAKKTGGNWYGT